MTVCIAALAEDGKKCVLVSDQMITVHFPIGYEHENESVSKIIKFNHQAYVLIAGDVLFANSVVRAVKENRQSVNLLEESLFELIKREYQQLRLKKVEELYLKPKGLTLKQYYQMQNSLNQNIVMRFDSQAERYNPQTSFIVVQKMSECYDIHIVDNPGMDYCFSPLGYVAIGSGAPHAKYEMIESNYSKAMSVEDVQKLVKKAKKRSEVAPGVGKETKLITAGGDDDSA